MSEDVSRFLSQVKELGERRIEEDEARSRELEEKILQDRKERQARRRAEPLTPTVYPLDPIVSSCVCASLGHLSISRYLSVCDVAPLVAPHRAFIRVSLRAYFLFLQLLPALLPAGLVLLFGPHKLTIEFPSSPERARSISPQKSSPANTPPPSQPNDSQRPERLDLAASPILYPPSSPQSQSAPQAEEASMATPAPTSTSPSKENESPLDAEIKPNYPPSPTRSGTAGRGLSWQRRPNSQASERSRSRPLSVVAAENATRSSNSASDQDTAAETPSRDQIASTLASKDPSWFRQTPDRGATSAAYRRNQVEDTQTVDPSSAKAQLPGMSRSTSGESFRNGDTSLLESPALRSTVVSPTNLGNAQRLDPPTDNSQSEVEGAQETRGPFSPPLGRASPTRGERPISPTKGMGGFVQSAMMKRSESVSKRWNVQSPAGLQRADTTAPNRNSYDPTGRTSASSRVRPKSMIRGASAEQARPSSSEGKEEERSASRTSASLKLDTSMSPEPQDQDSGRVTPPVSPSKTMDPRRWSPQKSSWLESALNKPESPKPKSTQPPPNQPAWMAELQKAKAQKASNPGPESSKAPTVSHRHQVSIGGLMRSSAPGVTTAPVRRGGLHSPSPSISSSSVTMTDVKSSESQSPTLSGPIKSRSESTSETKTALPSFNKVKPATPPKKDFRANLKPRAPPATTSTDAPEVEFKNVFGNLRKTTTQNYVAPDELKGNITRGKTALTVTGGPQKSERVDEFKDALLAKKKEFQTVQAEGRSIPRNNSVSSENPVPEGLLKRAELGRSHTVKRGSVSSDVPGTHSRKTSTVSQRDTISGNFAGKFERFSALEKRSSVIETSNPKSEGQGTSTEPSNVRKLPMPRPASGSTDRTTETNGTARLPGKISGSALANRFNPALAGFISRGPPPMASGSGASPGGTASSASKAGTQDNEAGSGPTLTHMTKNRARGPKRKAPTKSSAPPTKTEENRSSTAKRRGSDNLSMKQDNTRSLSQVSPVDSSKKEHAARVQPRPKPIALTSTSKPIIESTGSDEVTIQRSRPENKVHEQAAVFAAQKISDEPRQISPKATSPGKLNMNRMSRFMDVERTADKGNGSEQPKSSETSFKTGGPLESTQAQDAQQKPQQRSPSLNKPKVPLPAASPLPFQQEPSETGPKVVGTKPEGKVIAPLGPRPLLTPPVVAPNESLNSPARPLPKEPEKSPQRSPSPGLKSPASTASPMRSPAKQLPDAPSMLRDFFGSERPQRNYGVDAGELLVQRQHLEPPKIQTLGAQLFQLSSDGKKQPVPAHHERTLFEHEMYLCTHSFNNDAGRKMLEVYFWTGGEVSQSVIEDAEVFVVREARSFGGTLVRLKQGKETPEFLQALGGIVIIQRGSGNKFDSLAPHMLCGRRYHGHVVFDEVDFTSSALCSGFPYLITQGGRCYLWKGKGSSVEELGCARLIGMDYALSGELEEVEEGGEPTAFWQLFDGANRFGSADHWRLKPNYDKYCSRLFLSDAASPQQIVELFTFSQTDLLPTNIYVIDAFFELYIVVGSHAQAEYASFHNALDFAQEYAILAASVEDRPFVPVSTVVLEGIPRDMKSVFRKWQDALSPTIMNPNTGLKRGRSLKVVSLGQALQALSD
ncbi:hypothetical protein NUW58_g1146 [Xylaria curta]|uniref:Uncharacterized protein n=1 Tax=Xylaria curta TaxID=42375 RepID=A0ACC1PPV6_9PEZI|nr:hypothetical protein NUW58_g1146 [Xylaria curta]